MFPDTELKLQLEDKVEVEDRLSCKLLAAFRHGCDGERAMYDGWRYYHTVLQRARWDKPLYLGSLDIVHTAPTYAVEQAVIMVQSVWRKRQGWKMLMAAMASVWSKTVVWRTSS